MKIFKNSVGKDIFLFDGLGALLSLYMLGWALPAQQELVGMPVQNLYQLATVALIFSINSMSAFFFLNEISRRWLKLVIIGNLGYFVFSVGMVCSNFAALTSLGLVYFVAELIVLSGLVAFEVRILSSAEVDGESCSDQSSS